MQVGQWVKIAGLNFAFYRIGEIDNNVIKFSHKMMSNDMYFVNENVITKSTECDNRINLMELTNSDLGILNRTINNLRSLSNQTVKCTK